MSGIEGCRPRSPLRAWHGTLSLAPDAADGEGEGRGVNWTETTVTGRNLRQGVQRARGANHADRRREGAGESGRRADERGGGVWVSHRGRGAAGELRNDRAGDQEKLQILERKS